MHKTIIGILMIAFSAVSHAKISEEQLELAQNKIQKAFDEKEIQASIGWGACKVGVNKAPTTEEIVNDQFEMCIVIGASSRAELVQVKYVVDQLDKKLDGVLVRIEFLGRPHAR